MPDLTVVIPCRQGSDPRVTVDSLKATGDDYRLVIQPDEGHGANWARNRGFEKVLTPFVLFSDDDIAWRPDALRRMRAALDAAPEASYSYGAYLMPGVGVQCDRPFDADLLRKRNYISTMSLIRSEDFPGFDESIKRLQDYDLWLTMLELGRTGAYVGPGILFSTERRAGITYGNGISWAEADRIVRAKHGL